MSEPRIAAPVLVLALLLVARACRRGRFSGFRDKAFRATAAITGIVNTQDGLGLGGVAVVLQDLERDAICRPPATATARFAS